MKPTHILLTALLLLILCAAPVAADAVSYNGKTYTTYDQIYASNTLSSSEKLALVQEMAGWTPELEAYMEWKNSGGLEAYQAAVSGGNSTSSDYGWDEAPGDGLGEGGSSIEPEYSYQERQAYDAAYAAYQAEFAENYAATAAYTGSGSGTQADPYIITTPAELQSIRDDLNAYYVLGNDISLTSISWTPIGTNSAPFKGYLDGNGYTINGLELSNIPISGLFGCLSGATIINTRLSNFEISYTDNSYSDIGFFCGQVIGGCNFDSCIVEDSVISGGRDVGGFVGLAYSGSLSITNSLIYNTNYYSYAIDSITYANMIGGFATINYLASATISQSVIIGGNFYKESNNNYMFGGLAVGGDIYGTPSITISQSSNMISSMDSSSYGGRIAQTYSGSGLTLSNNYASSSLSGYTPIGTNTKNGADVSITTYQTQAFWEDTLGWDFDNTWYWDSAANLPNLQVFQKSIPPTISAISASPSIGGQQDTYTLSVSASTTAAGGIASYQWYGRIGSSGEWQAISDGTSATYQFVPGAYALGDFYFKCVVTGADGGIVDSYNAGFTNVKITVVLAPQITSPAATPASGPLTQTITLSADVTSTETATYQWQELIGNTWTNISGATAATATVNIADSAATTHSYRLAASNVGGTAYSSTVTYQSVAPPTFSAVSASPSQGTYTSTVQLSATVSGSDSLQWQELVGASWQNINGATSAVYSLTLTDTAATLHSYRLAATNIGGTAYSSTVTYQSVAPPVFSAFQVSPLSGGVPLSVSFSATASDTSGYRWEYSTDGNIWVQMASGASGSYTFTAEGVYYIRVIATGTGGSTTSASATVTASVLLPEFTQISASPTSGVAPFAVTLSASATNNATFVWQMQSGSSWVQIGSGSPLTYTIPSGTSAGMVYFRAVANNQYGSTTSQTLAVEVGAAPAAEIASPAPGAVFGSNRLISFAAADAGAGVTYSWNFGDGQTGSGRTVTHSYSENGFFMVTLTASSQFGSSEDVVRIEIVEASGDIWLANTDVSSSGVTLQATIEVSPVSAGTVVWFELESMSGQSVYKSPQLQYSGPVSYTASGLPLLAGQTYRAIAYSNYYGYSIPVQVTLVDAVQAPHETLGIAWNNGLNREPFNVSALVAAGVGVFGGALGGGAVGAAVSFGVIAMFVLVGLWLRQQDIVVPLTLTLIAGWFVIGNLPGDWQPIAYTLMVVCVVAIFFYLFRKRIE